MSDAPQGGIPLVTGSAPTAESNLQQFDPSLVKLRRLFARPNWRLGWYLWLRAGLLLMPFTLCLFYLEKTTKPETTIRKAIDVGWALLAIITFGIIHHSIRAWANRRYNMPLSGFLWWAFLWRFTLLYGAMLAAALFVFGGVTLSYLAISALIHLSSPGWAATKVVGTAGWFLGGLAGAMGIAVVSAITTMIPGYGMLAHRVIAAYSHPKPGHKWHRMAVRLVGLLMLFYALFVSARLIKDLAAGVSWITSVRSAIVLGVTLIAAVGLLRLRFWGRWAGILLLIYLPLRWTYWYAKKGIFPSVPELVFIGCILLPLLLLLLPVVRDVLQRDG